MSLFQECCSKFKIKLDNDDDDEEEASNYQKPVVEAIFGNINDVHECALRLADVLDEAMAQKIKDDEQQQNTFSQTQSISIGQLLWGAFEEGTEFELYLTYAENIYDMKQQVPALNAILNNGEARDFLKLKSHCLIDISKYLLHKLLLGTVYHFLYLFETIESLSKYAIDEDDKLLLRNILNSMQSTKDYFKACGFASSRRRPIEASFRMYQPQYHIQMLNQVEKQQQQEQQQQQQPTTVNYLNNTISSHMSIQSSATSITSSRRQALASNINELTEAKWKEIEMNVESFKLNSAALSSAESNVTISSISNNSIASSLY